MSARLLPALMATLAAILGLKAVAIAQAVTEGAPATATSNTPAAATAEAGSTSSTAANACPAPSFADQAGLSQAEVQVLQALGARRQALDARSGEIDTSGQLLEAAERRLDQRLAELRRLETSVNGLLGQLDTQQSQRVSSLVDVYQRMRAKDAATVFNQLDEDTLLLVASRMRQQNLAEVMGRMQPDRARRLTQLLAQMSQRSLDNNALLDRAGGLPRSTPAAATATPAAATPAAATPAAAAPAAAAPAPAR